jgi:O-antigen/teichoic acid export membrane protein
MSFKHLPDGFTIRTFLQRHILRARNAAWAASEGLINPLFQLALTPFLLHQLGKVEFGIWVLCLTFCSLGPLMTLAASAATLNRLSELLATKDKHGAARAFMTGLLLTGVTGSLATLALWFFSMVSYGRNMLGTNQDLPLLIALVGVTLLVQELDSLCAASLKANNQFDLNAKIDISFRILWVATMALMANAFGSAFACMAGSGAVITLKTIIKSRASYKLLGTQLRATQFSLRQLDRGLLGIAGWYWGQTIGGAIFNAADKFLVSILFGLETLSSYAICSQIAQFIHGIHASAGQVLLPWASKEAAYPSPETVVKFRRMALMAGFACLVVPCLVALMLPVILTVWISPEFARENYYLALALLASYAMLVINIPLHYILLGMGQVRLITVLNLVAGLLSIFIGWSIAASGIALFALSKCVYAPITLIAAKKLMRPN